MLEHYKNKYCVRKKEPGYYLYIGLETQLKCLLKSCPLINELKELKLIVNVDGLPIFKSFAGQVIPIIISVVNILRFKKMYFLSEFIMVYRNLMIWLNFFKLLLMKLLF